jgi:hypothetical protein
MGKELPTLDRLSNENSLFPIRGGLAKVVRKVEFKRLHRLLRSERILIRAPTINHRHRNI